FRFISDCALSFTVDLHAVLYSVSLIFNQLTPAYIYTLSLHDALPILSSSLFRLVSCSDEQFGHAVAEIALYDDFAVFGRTAHAASGLEHPGQLPEVFVAAPEAAYERHLLAAPRLAVEPYAQLLLCGRKRRYGFRCLGFVFEVGVRGINHVQPRFPVVVCHRYLGLAQIYQIYSLKYESACRPLGPMHGCQAIRLKQI